ncbi:MAG: hypothetical protein ACYTGL_08980 [Planctomycetota bacterium]|jgi:hypothetical protein
MGSFDWQLWTALAIVAAASFLVIRRVQSFMSGRQNTACDGCPSASPHQTETGDRLVDHKEIGLYYDEEPQ